MDCRHTDKTFYWFIVSTNFSVIPRGRENKIIIRQSVAFGIVFVMSIVSRKFRHPATCSNHTKTDDTTHNKSIITYSSFPMYCYFIFSVYYFYVIIQLTIQTRLYIGFIFYRFVPSAIRFLVLQSPNVTSTPFSVQTHSKQQSSTIT